MKKILSSVVAAGLIASVAFGEKVKLYTLDFYKNPNYEDTQQCYKFIDVNVNIKKDSWLKELAKFGLKFKFGKDENNANRLIVVMENNETAFVDTYLGDKEYTDNNNTYREKWQIIFEQYVNPQAIEYMDIRRVGYNATMKCIVNKVYQEKIN